MTARIPDDVFTWSRLLASAVPPRDPNDGDDDEEEEEDDVDDEREPPVIREPDEGE
jgi:hypothetical protein